MAYHLVWDVSDRIPEALALLPAIAGLLSILVFSVRRSWRAQLRSHSWLLLGASAVLWAAFAAHNVGGPYGLIFGLGPGLAMLGGAVFEWMLGSEYLVGGREHVWRGKTQYRRTWRIGTLAIGVAAVGFGLVALCAAEQIPAFELEQRLEEGSVSVVSGQVEQTTKTTDWGSQCFTVSGHRFCFDDSPSEVGYHQTSNDGGVIRDGLQVRISYVGDRIVRLEIADTP